MDIKVGTAAMYQAQTAPAKRVKIRQCVGCREDDEANRLLRFVAYPAALLEDLPRETGNATVETQNDQQVAKSLLFDSLSKLPGRGAYVHLNDACIKSALKAGFPRAFRSKLNLPDRETFLEMIQQGLRRRLTTIIRGGFRGPDAFLGETKVAASMKENSLTLLIIASNAGEATKQKYRLNAERKGIDCLESLFNRQELGSATGSDQTSLIGFRGDLANTLLRESALYFTAVSL